MQNKNSQEVIFFSLPGSKPTRIQMDKIIPGIITHATLRHIQRGVSNRFGGYSLNSYVNSPALHVKTMFSNPMPMFA